MGLLPRGTFIPHCSTNFFSHFLCLFLARCFCHATFLFSAMFTIIYTALSTCPKCIPSRKKKCKTLSWGVMTLGEYLHGISTFQ